MDISSFPCVSVDGRKQGKEMEDTHMHRLSDFLTFIKKHAFPFYALCQLDRENSSCGKSSPLLERMEYGERQEAVPPLERKSTGYG